jgi:uncharacterized membrane protein YfcA
MPITATDTIIAGVLLGAFSGGFVNGLAGFGTGLVAMGIWLHVTPPAIAVPLAVVCSIVAQVQTIPAIWHAIRPRRVLPFIVPGLLGVPIGTQLLTYLHPNAFRVGVGALLVGFSIFSLAVGTGFKSAWGGRTVDGVVGLAGGLLGGLAGLSGPLPTMWAAIRGWDKNERRGLFQAFNLSILMASLISLALAGHLTAETGWTVMVALPGTITGSWIGSRLYRRLTDRHFHNVILGLLAFSGVTLLWAGL